MSTQPESGQLQKEGARGWRDRESEQDIQPPWRSMENPSRGFNGEELSPENIQENSRMQ